jgi:hypothetical protein
MPVRGDWSGRDRELGAALGVGTSIPVSGKFTTVGWAPKSL